MLDSFDLSWLWSPKDYFYAVISAAIGAWLGILWAKRQFAVQRKKEDEKVRYGILETLRFNKERSEQAKQQLDRGGMPNFPLDGARLSSLVLQAHGILSDKLLRKLDWHRYQLDHITAKLATANSFVLAGSDGTPEGKEAFEFSVTMTRQALSAHYKLVIDGTDSLVADVEKWG